MIRTKGDGVWKKYTYQDLEFTITLSGLLVFDDIDFTGWDMLDNQINFVQLLIRCSFVDSQGNIRTVQGTVMIENTTFSYSPGVLVKNDLQLQGNGKMDVFDGYVPCPSVITGITVDGQTATDGIAHVSYTYTGEAYQIKYRMDGTGDYAYALADLVLDIPGLALGSHSVEIIPACSNGYEGTGASQDFVITRNLVCNTVITDITITSSTATAVFTGSATQMKYRIDGSLWQNSAISFAVPLGSLSVGNHSIEQVPICSNGVEGTGFVKNFTVSAQTAQCAIDYITIFSTNGVDRLDIYVNGVLTVSSSTTAGAQFFFVPNGAVIKATVTVPAGKTGRLLVQNTTSTTILYDQTSSGATVIQYIFTTSNGDGFQITGIMP